MENIKPAIVVLQIVDSNLTVEERDRVLQLFLDDLQRLEVVSLNRIKLFVNQSAPDEVQYRQAFEVEIPEPERVENWIKWISDRLAETPTEIRLTCTFDRIRVQTQTDSSEELLRLLPTVDTLLPDHQQIFRARAEAYASREGEISPVEREHLELLRHRYELDPDWANAVIAHALGPYADRQAKLDRYREVFKAELERQAARSKENASGSEERPLPLSESTWSELRRLSQLLGLSKENVEPIHQEYITHIQAKAEHLKQQEDAKTKLQKDTQLQDARQERAATQQRYRASYQQMFAAAIADTLYPSEFDRGRLEQARQDWDLDAEEIRAIERDVTEAQYGAINSGMKLDYARLRQLLWLTQWEEADRETERLILSALSRDMRPIENNTILKLHCTDVQTLDALWSRYSQGKFGFRAQHQIYAQTERRADDFLSAVGWQESFGIGTVSLHTKRTSYRDLQFSLDAPIGHLPTWRWGTSALEGDYVINEEIVHNVFVDLVEKCLSNLRSQVSPGGNEPS